MKKQILNPILIFFLLLSVLSSMFIPPTAIASDWIIDGDTVYIDDENAYLSATPHTIIEDTWVTFKLRSKNYSGDIDACWLFNTTNCKPTKPVYYKVGDGDWQILTKEFTIKTIDFENMTKAYLLENINIQNNTNYSLKCFVDIKFNTSGKYWWGVKPSALGWDKGYYIDPWWNSAWEYYIHLTIDNSFIENDLVNFPVLVPINYTISEDADEGRSIRFIGLDNTTQYNYEVEYPWNTTSRNYAWVNLTRVDASAITDFLMYFNNSAAIESSSSDTWDSNYTIVAHMNGTGDDADVYDSTANHYTGIAYGSNASTGQIATARTFTRLSKNYIDFQNASKNANLDFVDQTTVEMWTKDIAWNDSSTVMRIMYWDDHWRFFKNDNDLSSHYWYIDDVTGDGLVTADATYRTNGSWYYLWSTYSNATNRAVTWENTTKLDTGDTGGGIPGGSTGTHVYLGGRNTSTDYVQGCIDEFRLSNIQRNTSWMNASYHFMNQSTGLLSNGTKHIAPGTELNEPTGFVATTNSTTMIYLNWTKDVNATHTRIQRKTGSYPTDYSDGTNIYNGTGVDYENSGLTISTIYYYRAWSFNSTSSNYSTAYASASNNTGPTIPTGVTTSIDDTVLNISWTKGARADTTSIQRKVGSYPTSETDGTNIYNSTGTTKLTTITPTSNYYYRMWSYNNITHLFSVSVDVNYGMLVVSCYDEETNGSLYFDILVRNEAGDETYESRNNSNPLYVDVEDNLPLGNNIRIIISAAQNYSEKSETFTGYGVAENTTVTYVVVAEVPKSKSTTNVTCRNTTGATHSYPAFTLADDVITILANAADVFNQITVNYTHDEYDSRVYYRDLVGNHIYTIDAYLPDADETELYVLQVINDFDKNVEGVDLEIKRSIKGTYEIIASPITDADGKASVYLIPDEDYLVRISKSGFVTKNASFIPDPDYYGSYYPIIFRLKYKVEEVVNQTVGDYVTITGTLYANDTLKVTFYEKADETINTHFYIYESYNNTLTYIGEYNGTTSNEFTFWKTSLNTSRMHIIVLFMNHTTLGAVSNYAIYVMPLHEDKESGATLETHFIAIGGNWEYGWVNTLIWYLPCIIFIIAFASAHHPGMGVLFAGMYCMFVSWYLLVPDEARLLTFAAIAIVIGMIGIFLKRGRDMIH